MGVSKAELSGIHELLAPFRDLTVRAAELSRLGGSIVTVDLANSLIRIDRASWRMETESAFLLACEDQRDYTGERIGELDGRRLTAFEVSRYLDLTLDFEGIRLVTFVAGSSGAEVNHWQVQLPSGATLFAGPGSSWFLRRLGG